MLTIHQKGLAIVGVYPHEIAETKVAQVMEFSRKKSTPSSVYYGKRISWLIVQQLLD